jgi:apolipoprotein N-acyltransferase
MSETKTKPSPLLRFACALGSGLLLTLAIPPLDLWPLGLVALVPVHLAIRSKGVGLAAALGFVAGFTVHLATQTWWVDFIERFTGLSAPLRALGVVAILCSQAAGFAVWAGLSRLWVGRFGASWFLAAPLSIAIAEWIVPSLFPWHVGIVLWRVPMLAQVAELGAGPAVSTLVVGINTVVAEMGLRLWQRRRVWGDLVAAAGVIAVVAAAGALRAAQIRAAEHSAPKLHVGLLQPNFPAMPLRERAQHGAGMVRALREGTEDLAKRGAQLVVWSETAWPYFFDRQLDRVFGRDHPWFIGERNGSSLLMGAATHEFGTGIVYNSAIVVDPSGAVTGTYDKRNLLAFSEYVPFEARYPRWGEAVWDLLPDRFPLTAGAEERVLEAGPARVGVLICSEELEAGLAASFARAGAKLLVGMANDAWFGDGPAARQHLALATFRAIEARRALARVTTTGVSAVIDATGAVRLEGPLVHVPKGGAQPPTLLVAELPLLEVAALGPQAVRGFPHACALILLAAVLAKRIRRAVQ